jgi:hypothetical protein
MRGDSCITQLATLLGRDGGTGPVEEGGEGQQSRRKRKKILAAQVAEEVRKLREQVG